MTDQTRNESKSFDRYRYHLVHALIPFDTVLIVGVAINLCILSTICYHLDKMNPRIWNLFLVATGSVGAGNLVGFLYALYGDEKKQFSDASKLVTGLLGGFSITEILKPDGIIRRLFVITAQSCGGADTKGLVFFVVIAYFAMGFLALYVNKRLVLNPAMRESDALMGVDESRELLNEEISISSTEIAEKPAVPKEAQDAVESLVRSPEFGKGNSLESIKADGKVYYATGRFEEAIKLLKMGVERYGDDAELLLHLSHVLITADRPIEAISYLKRLGTMPKAPAITFKLLGYACLFKEDMLDESIAASQGYLSLYPGDAGTEFNLACAYAQRGPDDPNNRKQMEDWLDKAIGHNIQFRSRIVELLQEDFKAYAADSAFQAKYLQPSTS